MKKIFIFLGFSSFVFSADKIDSIIPDASYVAYENDYSIENKQDNNRTYLDHATFYTCDGNAITTFNRQKISFPDKYLDLQKKLDPSAPKPQAKSFQIQQKQCGHGRLVLTIFPFTLFKTTNKPTSVMMDYIIFYDKNGNKMECYPIDRKKGIIYERCPYPNYDNKIKTYKYNSLSNLKELNKLNFPLDLEFCKR